MKMYFVEIACGTTRFINKNIYLRAIVKAANEDEAKAKCLDHYRPYYESLNPDPDGSFKVQCCWTMNAPTKKAVKEVLDLFSVNTKMPMSVRDNEGQIIGHRYFNAYKTKKDGIEDWERINISWGDVYYDTKIGAYVVEMHPYMCMPAVVKVFEGKTYEVYQEALKWVEDNTMKKDYFAFKF